MHMQLTGKIHSFFHGSPRLLVLQEKKEQIVVICVNYHDVLDFKPNSISQRSLGQEFLLCAPYTK